MKKRIPDSLKVILIVFILFGSILISCDGQNKPVIHANVDACLQCGMSITQLNQACGYYHQGEFHTFCAGQCLLAKYQSIHRTKRPAANKVYFADYEKSILAPADSIDFLISGHITTVMNAGVISFKKDGPVSSYKKYDDELITDWRGLQLAKGKPDRKVNVIVSAEGVIPDVTMLNKDELVEWTFTPEDGSSEHMILLKGYEEMKLIGIKAGGAPVKVRMLADKPGAGFPFVRISDNQIIGMVKVTGAHTNDEEAM